MVPGPSSGRESRTTLAAFLLTGGSLGDRFGRREVYLIGSVWFALASAACELAPDVTYLIITRVRRKRVYGASWAMVLLSWCPMVLARCGDDWLEVLVRGWLRAGLGPVAGEVGLAGQGGPAEDGGEFCCLGSLAFPFGLDGREY